MVQFVSNFFRMDRVVLKACGKFYDSVYDQIKITMPRDLQNYTCANEYKLRCLVQLGYLASIKDDLVDAGRKFKEAYTLC